MYTDLFGKTGLKVNTHLHTGLSDGRRTPEEAAAMYKAEGLGHDGEGLTEARCRILPHERFIRAEVTDKDGSRARTNYPEL